MSRMSASSTVAIALAVLCGQAEAVPPAPGQLFGPPVAYNTGTSAVFHRLCDMNLDGNADLVVADRYGQTIRAWLGAANGSFSPQANLPTSGQPVSLTCADFNNDNNPDVAVTLEFANQVQVFLGDGAGNLSALTAFPGVASITSIDHGDFDEDGTQDLALANSTTGASKVHLFHGVGDGTFNSCNSYTVGDRIGTDNFVVHDFNLDGHEDIAVALTDGRAVRVLTGSGSCTFTVGPAFTPPTLFALGGLEGGDVNADGFMDLVSANNNSHGYAVFLAVPAKPDSFVVTDFIGATWNLTITAAIGDYDRDGVPDLAIGDYGLGQVIVLKGSGTGTFTELARRYPITGAGILEPADFNHDGIVDLSVSSGSTGNVSVMLGSPHSIIGSIVDVPNDQGRYVRITLRSDGRDVLGSATPIMQYEAYRRIDPIAAASIHRTTNADHPVGIVEGALRISAGEDELLLAGWEFVGAIPAHGEDVYSLIAPTLVDSTIVSGLAHSVFFIRAASANPLVYFDSPADSGYSVDNLPPVPPTSVTGYSHHTGISLSWAPNPEADLWYYRVYKGTSYDFVPTPADLIGTTGTPDFTDYAPALSTWYKLSAVDVSGNESSHALKPVSGIGGAPDVAPLELGLKAPARTSSGKAGLVVQFTLPTNAPARLELIDIQGRRLAEREVGGYGTGLHEIEFAGGASLASGMYIIRLTQEGASRTARAIVAH